MIKPGENGFELVENDNEFLNVPTGGYLCFLDPSPKLPSNLLANHACGRVKQYKNGETLNVLLIREKISKLSSSVSLKTSLQLILGNGEPTNEEVILKAIDLVKMKPKVTELRRFMDPGNLAEQAVGLNLKLMKWRQMPELDLEVLKETKCLLLGSGSLGCQVARNLLSWGYTKITFVDNGKVSYSNPVRQCLFTFDDSRAENNFKAEIAAKRLTEVYPKVVTRGHVLNIPMPGHTVA